MEIVHSKIYLLVDSQGNKSAAVVEGSSDTAQICGLVNKDGEQLHFESSAYHISQFCYDNDIQLKIISRQEKFDELWCSSSASVM